MESLLFLHQASMHALKIGVLGLKKTCDNVPHGHGEVDGRSDREHA